MLYTLLYFLCKVGYNVSDRLFNFNYYLEGNVMIFIITLLKCLTICISLCLILWATVILYRCVILGELFKAQFISHHISLLLLLTYSVTLICGCCSICMTIINDIDAGKALFCAIIYFTLYVMGRMLKRYFS